MSHKRKAVWFIASSIIGGVVITAAIMFASDWAIRHMPYRDKPMMPKPWSLLLLYPGFAALLICESGPRWLNASAFLVANVSTYSATIMAIRYLFRAATALWREPEA